MTAALLKKSPSLKSVLFHPLAKPTMIVGAIHNATQTTITRNARGQFGCVCSAETCSSPKTDGLVLVAWLESRNFFGHDRPPSRPTAPAQTTIAGNGTLR